MDDIKWSGRVRIEEVLNGIIKEGREILEPIKNRTKHNKGGKGYFEKCNGRNDS